MFAVNGNAGNMTKAKTVRAATAAGAQEFWRGKSAGILVALLALVLELSIAAAAYAFALGVLSIGSLHFAVVLLLALWVYQLARHNRDTSDAVLLLLTTLAVGPLGTLGTIFSAVVSARSKPDAQLLKSWYERISLSSNIDPVSRHCDTVAVGRTMDLQGPAPASFSEVLKYGSLRERQNALGLIARRFHPDYIPALKVALKSDLPVIRVQAAAVAAHVRVDLRNRLQSLLGEAEKMQNLPEEIEPRAAFLLASDIDDCLQSGLLDEKELIAGRKASSSLYDKALDILDRKQSVAEALHTLLHQEKLSAEREGGEDCANACGASSEYAAARKENAAEATAQQHEAKLKRLYEKLLLQRRRYDAFRVLRGDLPAAPQELWRIRPLPRFLSARRQGVES